MYVVLQLFFTRAAFDNIKHEFHAMNYKIVNCTASKISIM